MLMAREGVVTTGKQVALLKQQDVEQMHLAVLDVLEETGVRIEHEKALKLLASHGCRIDYDELRARFPRQLVCECLDQVPSDFTVKAPIPENDLIMGGDRLYFTHTSGMKSVDLSSFEPKVPTQAEYIEAVRVLDALDSIDMLGCYPYFGYEGISPEMAIPEGMLLHMKYSRKHQAVACSNDCELFTLQMAALAGHEVSATIGSSPPLTWGKDAVNAAFRIVESGFPISTVDGCMMGGTGPATPAGSVVTSSAEQMAMIVLVQLLNPGHRMLIGHFSAPLNMSTGSPAFGQIDASMNNMLFNQLWRNYNIPVSNGSPGYVNAKCIDYQAGYEKGMASLLAGMSGVNVLLLHFGVSGEITAHPLQAVLDDDIARMTARVLKGEEISEETIAVDVIKQVGPVPGHFLSQPHTLKWYRKTQCVPGSADRLTYQDWMQSGKKSALDYARERMEEILSRQQKVCISESMEEDLKRIVKEAEVYYSKRE